jgi:predicted ATPase
MIARMHSLLEMNSQFIIATHSPILMSYPDSIIYEITDSIKEVRYDETEHYNITKAFLNNPSKMLKILIEENDD